MDRPIDRALIDPCFLGRDPGLRSLPLPFSFFQLSQELIEQEAVLLGKLEDPLEDLSHGGLAHEPLLYSTAMRAALFVTCLGDQFFADAAADAVRLLKALGVAVEFPEGQTCCGQPAFNAGYPREARAMARHTLAVLADAEHVVLPSGSCAAMLRRVYPEILAGDPEAARAAAALAARTWELSEFVVRVLGVRELGRGLAGRRVAYHHGCHALRELGLRDEPLTLLAHAGAEVVPWEAAEECCGFGGLFAVQLPEVSVAMADRKLDTLPGVDCLTSADGGCLLQLAGRLAHRGLAVPTRHLASLLWEAHDGSVTSRPPLVDPPLDRLT